MINFKWLYIKLMLLLLLPVASTGALRAQAVNRYIIDASRQPVAYATVYFPHSHRAFLADGQGRVSLNSADRGQHCIVYADGFESLSELFTDTSRDSLICLKRLNSFYPTGVLRVSKGKVDKVVADKLLQRWSTDASRLKELQATAYLKSVADLENIPSLLKLSKSIRNAAEYIDENRFVMEEICGISRDSAGTWTKELLAVQNSIPRQLGLKSPHTYLDIYAKTILGKLSPLAKSSKRYYKYSLEYLYDDVGKKMMKLRFTPKREDERLASGYITAEAGSWSVRGIELYLRQTGGVLTLNILCTDYAGRIPLPVTIRTSKDFSLAGLKIHSENYLTVCYDSVSLYKGKQKHRSFSRQQVRPAYKYCLPLPVEEVPLSLNQLHEPADSVCWNRYRTLPLTEAERASYHSKREMLADALRSEKVQRPSLFARLAYYSVNEYVKYSPDSLRWVALPSLISYIGESNFVDGFWLGAYARLGSRLSKASALQLKPEIYYTTARKVWVGRATIDLDYAPRRVGHLRLSAGRQTDDYNGECGASRFFNGMFSTLFAENFVKLYGSDYVSLSNQVEPFHSMLLKVRMKYERRYGLENHQNESWFGKSAEPNIPVNQLYRPMPSHHHFTFAASLSYTPFRYYSMEGGKKKYYPSLWPTIGAGYELGTSRMAGDWHTPYHRFDLHMEQKLDFGFFNYLYYKIGGGLFINRSSLYFPDMKHFASSRLSFRTRSFDTALNCIDNYYLSTDNRWTEIHISYHSPYLLLKQIPFMQRYSIDEAIHFHRVMVKKRLPYTEVGYSVGRSESMRLGIFAGFDGSKFKSAGVRISLGWLNRLFP